MNAPMSAFLSLAVAAALATPSDVSRPPPSSAASGIGAIHPASPAPSVDARGATADALRAPPGVHVDIVSPLDRPARPYGIEFASGWPLVVRLAGSPQALGIATNSAPVQFPGLGQTGYLVLQDPDGCLELPPPFFRGDPPCSTAPSDETYVEFTPDADAVGREDVAGNPARQLALSEPAASGEPRYDGVGDPDNDGVLDAVEVPVGPPTGGDEVDGVGYGADDDVPGLVVLAPVGPGLVLGTDFSRPTVRVQRNLAGFLGQVGYELRDPRGSTTITASMLAPTGLFSPVVKVDGCVGTPTNGICDGATRYQVDGGPLLQDRGNISVQALYPQLLNARPYDEIRVFVVSGTAPSTLADLDGDGRVTAADATRAGYRVISNEAVVRIRQYATDICTGVPLANVVYADFDGNGIATSIFVCPAGPGQITKPPQ